MRILHTADWHLGKRLEHLSRFDEQQAVLDEICQIAEREAVDAVLIAGDLFDKFNPATEAIDLLYKTLKRLSNNGNRAVVAIAGNHDSPDRIEMADPLARECGIIFAGYPDTRVKPFELESGLTVLRSDTGFVELKLPSLPHPVRIILTPYANEARLRTSLGFDDPEETLRNLLGRKWSDLAAAYCDDTGVNLLVTHLFMMQKGSSPPEEPDEEKPILFVGGAQAIWSEQIPPEIQYVALGHLHGKRLVAKSPCPVLYSSSPLAYSMSEAGQQKYVVLIDVEPAGKASYTAIDLKSGKPLHRQRFNDIDEAEAWLLENPDSWVELTIVSDTYLTAAERKRLIAAHAGIVSIIPIVENEEQDDASKSIDPGRDIRDLFRSYFQSKHQQLPSAELEELFEEILSEDAE